MNINAANLKVALAASNDATRLGLTGINFTTKGTEATNGHILARISYPDQIQADDVPNTCPTGAAADLKSFIIPATAIKSLKTYKVKSLPNLTDSIFVDVDATNANGTAKFTSTNLDEISAPSINKIDAQFPDVERVIPTTAPDYIVGMNIEYLIHLLTIAKSVSALGTVTIEGRDKSAEIIEGLRDAVLQVIDLPAIPEEKREVLRLALANDHRASCNPWVIRADNPETGQNFTGIVMPIRL
jgi:DNA polymerase III sliding clamp (beta) subunit (PCNA family)